MPRNLSSSPPLDVLGSLADGRTADELAVVLGRSKCLLDADAHGSGDEEIVTAGAYTRLGALLWIDRGFWRIAPVPIDLGYLRFVRDTMVAGVRELLFAIDGGGSGGIGGYVAVGIADGSASITLHMHPSASEMSVRPLDETHLLITGRKLPDRPWGIGSNCCLPDGHEWLYEWTPDGYALVGERQARDPYFALNALLGALDAGRPELARDVATPTALAKASAFFGAGRFWKWTPSGNAAQQEQAELLRWDLLPASTTIEPEPVQYGVARYEPAGPRALVTFERRDGGWVATDVVPAP